MAMMRWCIAWALVLGAGQATQRDPYLILGERQVSEGNFEDAVFSLNTAVRRLSGQPGDLPQLVQAYVYFGAAYVGLNHEAAARGKFREALRIDSNLRLSPDQFPPRVLKLFEEMRLETTSASRKRGARTFLILGGIGAAGAVGAAAAFGGHMPNQSPSTPSISVSPEGQAISGVTKVTFRGSATDPDGDPLSYAWDFGDRSSAAGDTVSHVFAGEGTFFVTLTVSDGRGGSATSRTSVTAGTLNGTWNHVDCCPDGIRYTSQFQCIQSGSALDCQRVSGEDVYVIRMTGFLSDPRHIDVLIQIETRFGTGRGEDPFKLGHCTGDVLPNLACFQCVDATGRTDGLYRQGCTPHVSGARQ